MDQGEKTTLALRASVEATDADAAVGKDINEYTPTPEEG